MPLVDVHRQFSAGCTWISVDEVRAQLAALAALLDPAFAASATWPGIEKEGQSFGPPDDNWYAVVTHYADGDRALEVERRDKQGASIVSGTILGLREGWRIELRYDLHDDACVKHVWLHLPAEHVTTVVAHVTP